MTPGRAGARPRPPLATALAALLAAAAPAARAAEGPGALRLAVPVVAQAPERCGPAALAMVLRFHGADSAAVAEADRAYDPALRGSLVTDLAAAARRAGFEAGVETLGPDSLLALLAAGVPPIVLYQAGRGPLTRRHFAVVAGWDPARGEFALHDGGERPRAMRRDDLAKRWRTAGSQALVVRGRAK